MDELNFEFISDFSTLEALNVLGDATTSMCEPVLMDICRVVDSIDLKRAREAQMQRSGTVFNVEEEDEIEEDIEEEEVFDDEDESEVPKLDNEQFDFMDALQGLQDQLSNLQVTRSYFAI